MIFNGGLWLAVLVHPHCFAFRYLFTVKNHKRAMTRVHTFKSILMGCWLLAGLLLMGCRDNRQATIDLPFYRNAAMTPEWIAESSDDYASIHRVGDFSFVDQDGERVTEADFEGKIYVANFFFVHCAAICPTMRTNLAKIQETYRDDDAVLLLSHTVMPETDTVPVLQNYATVNNVISGKWHLVTGSREAVYALAREAYFADLEADLAEDNILHSENFFLIDQHRRIRGVYNGTLPLDVERLIEDIATLKKESA